MDALSNFHFNQYLSCVSEKWWPLVTGTTDRDAVITQVDRRAFELCVFSHILLELKSGDRCIPGDEEFA